MRGKDEPAREKKMFVSVSQNYCFLAAMICLAMVVLDEFGIRISRTDNDFHRTVESLLWLGGTMPTVNVENDCFEVFCIWP